MLQLLHAKRWNSRHGPLHQHLREISHHLETPYSRAIFDTAENGSNPRCILRVVKHVEWFRESQITHYVERLATN